MGAWGTGLYENDNACDFIYYENKRRFNRFKRLCKIEKDLSRYGLFEMAYEIIMHNIHHPTINEKQIKYIYKKLKSITISDCKAWKCQTKRLKSIQELIMFMEEQFTILKKDNVNLVGKYVYHLTKKSNIDYILKTGLIINSPSCGFIGNKTGVYVSNNINNCLKWKNYVSGYIPEDIAFVKFKVTTKDIYVQDERNGLNKDYIFLTNIEPNRLEVFY